MKIEIPEAHGQAIVGRSQTMQQLWTQFQLLRAEDKRHVEAVLKSLAYEPEDYEQYDLKIDRGHYYLELKSKQQEQLPTATEPSPAQQVNGAPSHPLN
jgi:hypothetical protein